MADDPYAKYGGSVAPATAPATPAPDPYAKYGGSVAQQSADFNAGVEKLESGVPYRFASSTAEMLNPVPLLGAIANLPQTARAMSNQAFSKTGEALAASKQGNYGRAALSAAEAVPVVGGLFQRLEDQIKAGNYAGAGGTLFGAAIPEAVNRLSATVKVPSTLNPVEQNAVQWGQRAGVPVNLPTATGNRFLTAAQAFARKQPLVAGRAAELGTNELNALANAGEGLISSTGQIGEKLGAGQRVRSQAESTIASLHQDANDAYDELRRIAGQNVKTVQVGTKPSTLLDPQGNPIMVPEFKQIEMPVATGGVKAIVKPILDRLEQQIPEAQKQASPGIGVLRQIISRPDQIDISTAISDLSAIQNIARTNGELDAVRGVSKGLAATTIPKFRAAIDAAAQDAGPDAVKALTAGRNATKAKYEAADALDALPAEPVQLVNRLTRQGDQNIQLLRRAQKLAPGEMANVGRSFLEGIFEDMTSEGGVQRTKSALNSWNRLGQQTKDILFPDVKTQQKIGDFFKLAEMTTSRANPSESATTMGAIIAMFHPKVLAAELFAGAPISDLLFGPGGAQSARTGVQIRLPKALTYGGRAAVAGNLLPPPTPPPQ